MTLVDKEFEEGGSCKVGLLVVTTGAATYNVTQQNSKQKHNTKQYQTLNNTHLKKVRVTLLKWIELNR